MLSVANPCPGSGLYCRETIRKFLTWVEQEPKRWFFRYLATVCRKKFYCKWIAFAAKEPFGNLNPTDINNPIDGEPQTWKKNSWSEIHFNNAISDVNKFAQFNGEIILNLSKNGGDVTRKLRAWAAPGQTKTTIARNLSTDRDSGDQGAGWHPSGAGHWRPQHADAAGSVSSIRHRRPRNASPSPRGIITAYVTFRLYICCGIHACHVKPVAVMRFIGVETIPIYLNVVLDDVLNRCHSHQIQTIYTQQNKALMTATIQTLHY